jgi:SOS-response transcriptional repressor LexA
MNNKKENPIAVKLKQLLYENDLTPTELARRIQDIPQQTIQRIAKGKIKKPHARTLETIANYFGISSDEFTQNHDAEILFSKDEVKASTESKNINVYNWKALSKVISSETNETVPIQKLVVMASYNENTFGVIMPDSSMAPYFSKDSILIIEPNGKFEDRSFVLAQLENNDKFLFRQLLSDGEHYFLKALSTDLSTFPIRQLEANDIIIGNLVETRQLYFKTIDI